MSETVVDSAAHAGLLSWLVHPLQDALSRKSHALLIEGPSGCGQYELALSLVKAWLCERRAADDAQACGRCESCNWIAAHGHPDLHLLMPETVKIALNWPLSEKAQDDIDGKKRKPSQVIRIADVVDLVQTVQLSSARGRGQAVLIYPADAMNSEASNALLKTLEEPNPGVRLVLATQAGHDLIPTIRSRCQSIHLRIPSRMESLASLQLQNPKESLSRIELALNAAGGRPGDAAALLERDWLDQWHSMGQCLTQGKWPAGCSLPSPRELLETLLKFCHDAWAMKVGASPLYFKPGDFPRRLPTAKSLQAWQKQLQQLYRVIDHTWRQELLLEDLFTQAQKTLNSAP